MTEHLIMDVVKNRNALLALAGAGVLWGLTVPLSKLALGWLAPAWLTVARFAVAAPILAVAGRRGLRQAFDPGVLASGAVGFGLVVVLQNAGIARTSVSHAAVIVGAVPVLVALISSGLGHGVAHPRAWTGYGVALAGVALVAGAGGGGATVTGDLLVLGSAALSACFIVVQPRLLAGRDAAAVTAVQFTGGGLAALPIAVFGEGGFAGLHGIAAAGGGPMLVFVALALLGTLAPFWLFAFGQSRVPAQLAGAFVNLEPVVGAAIGWLAFGNSAALGQLLGAAAVLGGIALSAMLVRTEVPAVAPIRYKGERATVSGADRPGRGDQCQALPRVAVGGGRRGGALRHGLGRWDGRVRARVRERAARP
jgi:O-acetylserine/cysteine efflux transporter